MPRPASSKLLTYAKVEQFSLIILLTLVLQPLEPQSRRAVLLLAVMLHKQELRLEQHLARLAPLLPVLQNREEERSWLGWESLDWLRSWEPPSSDFK